MRNIRFLVQAAAIAALYVVLTFVSYAMGLSSGAIQLRLSEALTVLPACTFAAVPGLYVGCLLANLLTGCAVWDTVFGSLATLLGALGTYWMRSLLRQRGKTSSLLKDRLYLAGLPAVVANMLVVPFVLRLAYGVEDAFWYLALTVGAGEVASCMVLGGLLLLALRRRPGLLPFGGEK